MAELTPKQQAVELLKNQNRFLILTHKNPDGDALGSLIALYMTLLRLKKDVMIVCSDALPSSFNFVPGIDKIEKDFNSKRDFVISLDIKNVHADKVMYKIRDGKLEIIITPENGQFDQKMVSYPKGGFNFDAIIVVDSPDLERVGKHYEENTEIFFEVPVLNIDHHPGNDHFGKINLVDITATSTCEVLVSLIESLTGDPKFFDENIATALLLGIITDTNSFQNSNTTPKSLTVAAQLVALGAHQQEIIKNIYKTKPVSTLHLWGRALSNLHEEKEGNFVWSELFKKDFEESGASVDESTGLIDELLKTASGVEFALLLSEKNGAVHGSLRSTNRTKDVASIAKLFKGGGHAVAAAFQIDGKTLKEVSADIIKKINQYQANLQGKTADKK